MTSLLSSVHGGGGTRNNKDKRDYIARHLNDIEYRTLATKTRDDASKVERELKTKAVEYLFPT
jgi:hypothetical protein